MHGSVDAVTGQNSTTFEAIEGMAVFDSETQSFWVAPRPKDKSGVVYDELSETDKNKFDASRFKEIDNLLKLNGVSVMSPEESDHFAKTTPENIIPTNMLDKWKLQGFSGCQEQECVGRLERSHDLPVGACCTHSDAGRDHALQWLASAKVTGRIADLTNALGQARKTSPAKLPPGVTHPKVGPRQLLCVETDIYGLVSGPSWLRASLTVDLFAAEYVKKIRTTNACSHCSHCSLPMTHRKTNCCSTLTIS